MKNYKKIITKYLKKGDNVLELGCGDGKLINGIVDDFDLNKVVAVDYYSQPEKLNNKIKFLKQDIEKLEIDEKFNFIIISHVLEHIKSPLILLEKLRGMLRDNGKIFIVVPNRYGFRNEARVYLPEHGKHYFLWDIESLQFSLERIGYTCRFHNLYVKTNKMLVKVFCFLFRIQNSELVCVAMKDINH